MYVYIHIMARNPEPQSPSPGPQTPGTKPGTPHSSPSYRRGTR